MRIPILIFATLALSACGSKSGGDNSALAEQNAASQIVVTNDVTAIDAATGEAANMAPDVNYTLDETNLESGNTSDTTAAHRLARKSTNPAPAENSSTEAAPANNAV